jgi:hypothetical protein
VVSAVIDAARKLATLPSLARRIRTTPEAGAVSRVPHTRDRLANVAWVNGTAICCWGANHTSPPAITSTASAPAAARTPLRRKPARSRGAACWSAYQFLSSSSSVTGRVTGQPYAAR